jgi:hypothetical protein
MTRSVLVFLDFVSSMVCHDRNRVKTVTAQ